jgi:hypothetical protein
MLFDSRPSSKRSGRPSSLDFSYEPRAISYELSFPTHNSKLKTHNRFVSPCAMCYLFLSPIAQLVPPKRDRLLPVSLTYSQYATTSPIFITRLRGGLRAKGPSSNCGSTPGRHRRLLRRSLPGAAPAGLEGQAHPV